MIAKRVDSEYEPGRRSGAWLKVKAQNEQEFVIGGCTPPQGSRKHFGSILVGYYEKGKLMFASGAAAGLRTGNAKVFISNKSSRTSAAFA